jgi:hypothetical protein
MRASEIWRLSVATISKTTARDAMESAHEQAAQACGRLALILASGRGLNKASVLTAAGAFNKAADALLSILEGKK